MLGSFQSYYNSSNMTGSLAVVLFVIVIGFLMFMYVIWKSQTMMSNDFSTIISQQQTIERELTNQKVYITNEITSLKQQISYLQKNMSTLHTEMNNIPINTTNNTHCNNNSNIQINNNDNESNNNKTETNNYDITSTLETLRELQYYGKTDDLNNESTEQLINDKLTNNVDNIDNNIDINYIEKLNNSVINDSSEIITYSFDLTPPENIKGNDNMSNRVEVLEELQEEKKTNNEEENQTNDVFDLKSVFDTLTSKKMQELKQLCLDIGINEKLIKSKKNKADLATLYIDRKFSSKNEDNTKNDEKNNKEFVNNI